MPTRPETTPDGLIYRTLADIEPEDIPWLWPGRIPLSMLTLLVGDPDQGKSYLTLDLAARISQGAQWPDGGYASRGPVVILADEDHAASVIRPRLDKLRGDAARIKIIETVKEERAPERAFRIDRDLVRLANFIEMLGAPLVIIDPLNNYLGRSIDPHKDTEIRSLLMPLVLVAKASRAAIVAVMHLTKDRERLAIHRVLGSIGYTGVARSVLGVASDPLDDERHIFGKIKLNIAGPPSCLAYRITDDGLEWEPGRVHASLDTLLRGEPGIDRDAPQREQAKELLLTLLNGGQKVSSTEADKQRLAAGISRATWFRAREELRVKAEQLPHVYPPTWVLTLPQSINEKTPPQQTEIRETLIPNPIDIKGLS